MRIAITFLTVLLGGCATTPPIDLSSVDKTLTPDRAIADVESARGHRVAWGGVIVNLRNLKDTTEIEVLGYPLASDARPDLGAPPQRRFLLIREGYLETADYRNGRLVSGAGTVTGTRNGKVGDAPYVYPVLQAEQAHLWPLDEERRNPNVNFGIGIGVIFGR